jgi:hypothetical protein
MTSDKVRLLQVLVWKSLLESDKRIQAPNFFLVSIINNTLMGYRLKVLMKAIGYLQKNRRNQKDIRINVVWLERWYLSARWFVPRHYDSGIFSSIMVEPVMFDFTTCAIPLMFSFQLTFNICATVEFIFTIQIVKGPINGSTTLSVAQQLWISPRMVKMFKARSTLWRFVM